MGRVRVGSAVPISAGVLLAVSGGVGAGCAGSNPAPPAAVPVLGAEVLIPVTRTVEYPAEGLRVGFERVVDDSRCPPDVDCVWEGDATVRIALSGPGSAPVTPVELHTSARSPQVVEDAGLSVELVRLNDSGDLATLRVASVPPKDQDPPR